MVYNPPSNGKEAKKEKKKNQSEIGKSKLDEGFIGRGHDPPMALTIRRWVGRLRHELISAILRIHNGTRSSIESSGRSRLPLMDIIHPCAALQRFFVVVDFD